MSPDCLAPHLTPITTVMLLSLRSTEGVTVSEDFSIRSSVHHQTLQIFLSTSQAHLDEDKQFVLLDDDDADDEGEEGDVDLNEESETEVDDRDVAGYVSVSLSLSLFHHVSFVFSYVRALIRILSILSGSVWKMLT